MCILWKEGFPGGASGKEHACRCRRHSDLALHIVKRRDRHRGTAFEKWGYNCSTVMLGKLGLPMQKRNSDELNTQKLRAKQLTVGRNCRRIYL